jgi:hypothetical protein
VLKKASKDFNVDKKEIFHALRTVQKEKLAVRSCTSVVWALLHDTY